MRGYTAIIQGGLETLKPVTMPGPPAPGPGEVHVRLRRASLNYRDLMLIRSAGRVPAETAEYVPLSDAAGEVVGVGTGVWRVSVGDRVALTFHPDWIAGPWVASPNAGGRGGGVAEGVLREEIVVRQDDVVLLPDYLSFDEAACLPCAGVTAWSALSGPAPLLPGDIVLVQGTGGVALFALQFSRLFGARVIATTSTAGKADLLRGMGAETVVNYVAEPDWQETVVAAAGGQGVDVVVEVGGAATLDRSIGATRQAGRVSLVGLLTGLPATATGAFMKGVTTSVIRVGSRADFVAMLRAMEAHRVHPVIDSTFKFEDVPAAFERLERGGHVGKIVIDLEG